MRLVQFWVKRLIIPFSIGSLDPGTHTLTLVADSTSQIAESNESDNSFTKTITVQSPALPNLRPFRPSAWSDVIVVSNKRETHFDSPTLSSVDTLFVDWAVLNDGLTSIDTAYSIILRVDGQQVGIWTADPPHKSNFYFFVEDFELGTLSPGIHSIQLIADSHSEIEETSEMDNSFTKSISVLEAVPNLTSYRPAGWSAPVVISKRTGTNQNSHPFEAEDTVFVDWAVINNGNGPTNQTYNVTLLLNEQIVAAWPLEPPHQSNFFRFVEDFSLGQLEPGNYTIKLVADSSDTVKESNEADNTFMKSFTVKESLPNLTPFQPDGWSSKIVVSKENGNNTDSENLISTDNLSIDWAVINGGQGSISSPYRVGLFVDGQPQGRWIVNPPHDPNFFVPVEDFQLGTLPPGTHTLTLKADSESEVEESDETDNAFTRQVHVDPAPDPDQQIFIVFPRIESGTSSGTSAANADPTSTTFGTGVAIANPTDKTAEVELLLVGDNGFPVEDSGIVNPVTLKISPESQIARTIPELFGSGAAEIGAWMFASSKNLGIVGFFLTFSQDGSRVDGAEANVFPATTSVVFPEVSTGQDRFTELVLIGSGAVDLELYDSGETLVESKKIELPGDVPGRFVTKLDEIFPGPFPESSYVLARASQSRIMGYENFGSARALAGRNAIPVTETGREVPIALFGAQLAEVLEFQSTITVINPTNRIANLTFSAFMTGVTGTPASTASISLQPKAILRVRANELLDLPEDGFVGWLRVDSDISGIVGNVTFGDANGIFSSSVQLQQSPVRDVVFPYIADGQGFLTGLTFLNVSADPAVVELDVFNAEGEKTGSTRFILQAFEHRPRPGFEPQIGGYIRFRSDISIFTFELLTFVRDGQVESLAAVPPQRGYGDISGRVTPIEIEESSSQTYSNSFEASRAKGVDLDMASEFVPGQAIVRFRSPARSRQVLRDFGDFHILAQSPDGVSLLRSDETVGVFPLFDPQSSSLEFLKLTTLELIEQLNSRPEVLYAEPNYLYHALRIPNDEYYSLQWHYPNIDLPAAWDIATGDPGIVVAVIDTGARFDHPDLGPRLTGGQFDFISDPVRALDGDGIDPDATDPGDPSDFFDSFHGTHVAGTLGAVTNNGAGVAGVNWHSPLMTLRVLGAGGQGANFDIIQAVLYAARLPNVSGQLPAKKARVINMSLGGPGFSLSLAEAVAAAQAANVVVVAAAGNDSSAQLMYPASYDGVVSVGATGVSGKAPYSNYGSRIDVVAPGGSFQGDQNDDGYVDGILSTWWDAPSDSPATLRFKVGTSMASPHIAGVASLIQSVNPGLSPFQVRKTLQETTRGCPKLS